jgi:hypothetical protein
VYFQNLKFTSGVYIFDFTPLPPPRGGGYDRKGILGKSMKKVKRKEEEKREKWNKQDYCISLTCVRVTNLTMSVGEYCRSMCEIYSSLSGRKNDKRLFAHGNPLYFLNIICTHFVPALLHTLCICTTTASDLILKITY